MMTAQEIFDTVVQHLYDQGGPAKDANDNCVYRADNGRKCAFGILIPDEFYDPEFERISAHALITNRDRGLAEHLDSSFFENTRLIEQLQNAHDSSYSKFSESTMTEQWNRLWKNNQGHEYGYILTGGIAWALHDIAQNNNLDASLVLKLWPKT